MTRPVFASYGRMCSHEAFHRCLVQLRGPSLAFAGCASAGAVAFWAAPSGNAITQIHGEKNRANIDVTTCLGAFAQLRVVIKKHKWPPH